MESPSLSASPDSKRLDQVPQVVTMTQLGHEAHNHGNNASCMSSTSTLYSERDQFHAFTQHKSLLMQATLAQHSILQHLSYIRSHLSEPFPFRADYKRGRLRSKNTICGHEEGQPRTSSLDRGRNLYCDYLSQEKDCFPLPQYRCDSEESTSTEETDLDENRTLWSGDESMPDPKSQLPKPAASVTSRRSRQDTDASSIADTNESVKPKKIKSPSPYDKDFQDRVLEPRSIKIVEEGSESKAHLHFNVEEPNGNRRQYYTEKRNAPDSSVWVESDDTFVSEVVREYLCMDQRGLCEAEFATYAREVLLKRERRFNPFQEDEERCWKTERMIELVAKPSKKHWVCPPLVGRDNLRRGDTPYTDYDFDLRPDCAYWLSLQAFSREYMLQVLKHTHVVNKTVICPYLTIEFKRDDAEDPIASHQVAAASALALYNRFLLRKRAFDLAGRSWEERDVQPLRHYGMTFNGYEYAVWCIKAKLTSKLQWNGCIMEQVWQGNCVTPISVRELVGWINEIHCWGLTSHGPECQNDVKLSLKAREGISGVRVSAIVPLPSDDAESQPDSTET